MTRTSARTGQRWWVAAALPMALALAGIPLLLASKPASHATAQTVSETLTVTGPEATADTYIREAFPATANNISTMAVTGDGSTAAREWSAIRFDTTGIPAGVQVTNAKLVLDVDTPPVNSMAVTALRLGPDASWTELSTWTSASASWSTGVLSNTVQVGPESTTVEFDVTADVAAFAAGTTNRGWVLRSLAGTDSVEFATSESATADDRPKLVITYAVPAATYSPTGAYGADATYEDTTITSDDPSVNRSSLDSLTVGKTAGSNSESLLRFPLGGQLSGSQIASATLSLTILSDGQARTLGVGRVCQPASLAAAGAIAAATYNGLPYGALAPVQTSQVAYSPGQAVLTIDVTAIVQSWANGEPNLGFSLAQLSGPAADTVRFYSFNASTASARPTLDVQYYPGQGTPQSPVCGQAPTATPTATTSPTATATASPSASPSATATATATTPAGPVASDQLVVVAATGPVGRSRLTFSANDLTSSATDGRFIVRSKDSNQYFNAVTGMWSSEKVENQAVAGANGLWTLAVTGDARRGIANTVVLVEFAAKVGPTESYSLATAEITVR